jgi:hypothetical protein
MEPSLRRWALGQAMRTPKEEPSGRGRMRQWRRRLLRFARTTALWALMLACTGSLVLGGTMRYRRSGSRTYWLVRKWITQRGPDRTVCLLEVSRWQDGLAARIAWSKYAVAHEDLLRARDLSTPLEYQTSAFVNQALPPRFGPLRWTRPPRPTWVVALPGLALSFDRPTSNWLPPALSRESHRELGIAVSEWLIWSFAFALLGLLLLWWWRVRRRSRARGFPVTI